MAPNIAAFTFLRRSTVRCGKAGQDLRAYGSLSGGERRRADFAILLALSGVAEAARGGDARGVLFLDEVGDSLDPTGIAGLAEVLEDLARDRCVVAITHRAELAARLPAVLRLRVDGGRAEVV